MSDRISQLQSCLDQLVTQFFSAINYINQHHDLKIPEGSPAHVTKAENAESQAVEPAQFTESLKELSRDIVIKAKQIQKLIESLPELDNVNNGDLSELEQQLIAAREEEAKVAAERAVLLGRCDQLIMRLTSYKMELDRIAN